MAERVFCIDFGSSFTKIALRRDPSSQSELLSPRAIGLETDFCIPSTVVVDKRGSKPVVECGEATADRVAGAGIDVYTNWKKWLFQATPSLDSESKPSPLEAFLRSDELKELASKYEVSAKQIRHLEQLVEAASGFIGRSLPAAESKEKRQQATAFALANYYFKWLREYMLAACHRLPATGLKYEEIPVRITVPAFSRDAATHPGTVSLLEAMRRAGWPLHPERPVETEPYSNAVGILTSGNNVTNKRRRIHFREMFEKGPFITVLKDPVGYPSYRAVVVDIGAFTTDFAAITLDPKGDKVDDPDQFIGVLEHSEPVGVSNLDERIRAALPKEKTDGLKGCSPREWEKIRELLYGDLKPYRKPGLIVGGGDEAEVVKVALAEFSKEIASAVERFCGGLPAVACEELILTGGGNLIPTVRNAVLMAGQSGGRQYIKNHVPLLRKHSDVPRINKLDERLTRGGSAIGGASIYFDRDFY